METEKIIYEKICQQTSLSYQFILAPDRKTEGIQCLLCGQISYDPSDVKFRFCSGCDKFHS
ncbi:hypothetical protein [Xanthocytophaga agilis]|uniref:Uncharacterized protein n=1 Tax=Xanthocytophaga agilis TaxID=3048010 RepID=A0AAE3UCV5_9BACT|nr:hypothetical protein [Xanthocytophaga agilis]MDJ1500520.1 hypothetical protein [Xanthocytophaga agilis]